ncbi:MAG: hypothetical protein J7K75_01210 [Desulfuromonas sp.]|nr:hypothetical protein [Desulfuromonas sp.]
MLKKIVESPYLNLLSGLVLLMTAGYETWKKFEEFHLAAHHGIVFFSIVHIVKKLCMASKRLRKRKRSYPDAGELGWRRCWGNGLRWFLKPTVC